VVLLLLIEMFSDDEARQGYSYDVHIPKTEDNRHVLTEKTPIYSEWAEKTNAMGNDPSRMEA
jgi:hypothetical protein